MTLPDLSIILVHTDLSKCARGRPHHHPCQSNQHTLGVRCHLHQGKKNCVL